MKKILDFQSKKEERCFEEELLKLSLEQLLNRSKKLSQSIQQTREGDLIVIKENFRMFLEKIINEELIKRKKISSDYFFCGNYVSQILNKLLKDWPDAWEAFYYEKRYQETGKSTFLQEGANMCFLICSLFPERGNWRLMSLSYYFEKGKVLYNHFYNESRKPVFYHMTEKYEEMVEITQGAIN